ncbi:hypothetical protein JTB14_013447 [Gonioctena quinquepunctata]|nr:hypothetical protein JTB14_013447 [Gonioctena quinquepunctata]
MGTGVNKSLSADYDWPEKFGRGIGEMENPWKNESHIIIEKEKTSEKSKLSKSAECRRRETETKTGIRRRRTEAFGIGQIFYRVLPRHRYKGCKVNLEKMKILQARQIIDKDFPIFCGNPEKWPLFYEQYERVCKMCSFSQEEIMIKLRKCLRGEAKSAVAGMLLASENVPMYCSIGLFSTWLADMANAACCVYTSEEPKKFEEPWKNVKKPTFQQKQKWPETVLSTNTEGIKSCRYCENGEHLTSNCPQMKLDDVNTRWEIIKGNRRTVQLAKRNVLLRMIPVKLYGPRASTL